MSDAVDKHALRTGAAGRLRAIQEAFRRSRHNFGWQLTGWRWRWLRFWRRFGALASTALAWTGLGVGALGFYDLSVKFDSAELALRHVLAAPNCDAARALELAPARRGEPGYYERHDGDGDGVACEVWPR